MRRQRRAGAGGAAGAEQPVQPVIDHQGRGPRNLDHLMPQWLQIFTLEMGAAATTGVRVLLHHLVNALDRQQLRPRSRMALLATSLAATAFAPFRRLVARRASAQRWPGPSLDGGLEDLRELRPIRCRMLASSLAEVVSCTRRSSFSCLRPWISCCWDNISVLTPAGDACQSASAIPAGGMVIEGGLRLRCNRIQAVVKGSAGSKFPESCPGP